MTWKLGDLENMVESYDNPCVWVKSDIKYHKKIMSPSSIYVDDGGDIIIEVPCDFLTEEDSE